MNLHKQSVKSSKFWRTFIGDSAFYNTVLALVVPIIVQNMITNLVGLLNNIMVGQLGTAQMSGVAIANQLIFVFNITIFGGLSGPGIFGAQFYGAGNIEGLRNTFRFKLWTAAAILVSAITVFLTYGNTLISLYLTGKGNAIEAAAMLKYGSDYLKIMLLGLLPFALTQVYIGTLRETGETKLPMKASIIAVFTNLILNYFLIFGKLGLPALGVTGAAVATVISRYIELAVIVIYTSRYAYQFKFIRGLYSSLRVPLSLVKTISQKGMPLLINELLWSISITALMQIFSTCGLNVVAGLNISSTVANLFSAVQLSLGVAVAVIIGQDLGAGDIALAKTHVWKLIFFCFCTSLVIGVMLAVSAPFIPYIYNTTEDVRKLATHFMLISAVCMVFGAITNSSYFAIRSGGKTIITLFFDSAYSWVVGIPYAFVLVHFTTLNIFIIYPLAYIADLIKSIIGILIVRTGYWAQNIVVKDKIMELGTEFND